MALKFQARKNPEANTNVVPANFNVATKYPNPFRSKKHPMNNEDANQKLVEHIIERLRFADQVRNPLIHRYKKIDRDIAGYIKRTEEDQKRERENKNAAGGPQPLEVNLQLVWAQLDNIVTYLMEVFAPDEGFYEALAPQDRQAVANSFAALMNRQAKDGQYYTQFQIFIWNCLKYNLGALRVEWHREMGIKLGNAGDGSVSREEEIIREGNLIKALDPYNTLWDVSVNPWEVAKKGEFFAEIEPITKFRAVRMAENKEIFNIERFINTTWAPEYYFYRPHPRVRMDIAEDGVTDWVKILSAQTGYADQQPGIEICHYYGWLRGKDWGLSDNDDLSIWRISMAQNKWICATTELTNAHNMLPIGFAQPSVDNMVLQQKSAAEVLAPYQDYGSFLMNVHVKADRKRLYGITLYDPNIADLSQIPKGDVAARIPTGNSATNKNLNEAIAQFTDAPETSGTLEMLATNIELMEQMYPSDTLGNVTDLERATQYQAAATVHNSNKRSHKQAKIVDDQAIAPVRFMAVSNILEFQTSIELQLPNGQTIEVNPVEFRKLGIQYFIGEGLQSLDRMATWLQMKDVINGLLQSPQANAEVDMLQLISAWSQMGGLNIDLTQFRRLSPTQSPQAVAETEQAVEEEQT